METEDLDLAELDLKKAQEIDPQNRYTREIFGLAQIMSLTS